MLPDESRLLRLGVLRDSGRCCCWRHHCHLLHFVLMHERLESVQAAVVPEAGGHAVDEGCDSWGRDHHNLCAPLGEIQVAPRRRQQ